MDEEISSAGEGTDPRSCMARFRVDDGDQGIDNRKHTVASLHSITNDHGLGTLASAECVLREAVLIYVFHC
jgi:hypothetical protein